MNDVAEIVKLSLLLERKLAEYGILDKGEIIVLSMPTELQEKIDGLVENISELDGLLRIGQAARRGEAISPPVAVATLLMIEEICEALFEPQELRESRRLH